MEMITWLFVTILIRREILLIRELLLLIHKEVLFLRTESFIVFAQKTGFYTVLNYVYGDLWKIYVQLSRQL